MVPRRFMLTIPVTDRCRLVPLELADADELFDLTDANRRHLRRWLPWLDSVRRVDDTRTFIRAAREQAVRNDGVQLALTVDGRIAGVVGHHHVDWRNRSTSIGYWIGESYQGRGLATAASRTLIGRAFERSRLNRIEIRCASGNHRSRAIPIRLGLREEGLLREAEWLYDHFVDHVVYAIVASEWRAAQNGADGRREP
jgi:ribosomal-protein-serine acetyltransferase